MRRVGRRRGSAVSVVGVGLLGAVGLFASADVGSAWAQPKSSNSAPTAKPDAKQLEEALKHMEAGSLLYKDPPQGHKCEEALAEFSKAFELSGSWRALRAMAICEFYLERDGEAIAHYEEVLVRGKDQLKPDERKAIEDDIKRLKPSVATVTFTTNQPNARLVTTRKPLQGDDKNNRYTVPAEGLTIGMHPGQYKFVATVDGFEDITWEQEIANGSKLERALEFVPKKTGNDTQPLKTERPIPPTVWIFTALTGASAVTSGVFMGLAKLANDDFEARNGAPGATQGELEDLRQDVITKNIVADVFLGVTAVSLGLTLIFYFTRPEVVVSDETALTILPLAPLAPSVWAPRADGLASSAGSHLNTFGSFERGALPIGSELGFDAIGITLMGTF